MHSDDDDDLLDFIAMCVVVCVLMSCSTGFVSDGLTRKGNCSLLLFCRKLMDLESLLCWQAIHTPI